MSDLQTLRSRPRRLANVPRGAAPGSDRWHGPRRGAPPLRARRGPWKVPAARRAMAEAPRVPRFTRPREVTSETEETSTTVESRFPRFRNRGPLSPAVSPEEARAPRHFVGRVRREAAMTEEKKEQPKNVAVDLECDDEFEEFGNEGASRVPARVEISTRTVPEISSGSPHPSPFLTDPDPRTSPTDRVGRRGRGRRGCQAVGGGLGRHRRERRLHTPAEGGAGEAPVARSNRRA